MNTDGKLTKFYFGPEGWIEECNGSVQGYRIVSQRSAHNIIAQIVEEMPDGWSPSKIYKQDVSFIKQLATTTTTFREDVVGCWNRRMIDINTLEDLEETPVVASAQQHADTVSSKQSLLGAPPSAHVRPPLPQKHQHQHRRQQQFAYSYPQNNHRHHKDQLLIALSPLPQSMTSPKRR